MNPETRNCQNCKQNFVIEPEDFAFYEKIKVPAPTWCPECRFQRRMAFWNQRNLFRKKDAITDKEIFSNYPAESPAKIYEHSYWWSDKWDPMDYGRDYDFSKPFFEQIKQLSFDVPWAALSVQKMVNSDYCNQATGLKNSYLCFNGNYFEDCAYGVGCTGAKNSFDFLNASALELCYEVYQVASGYKNFFTTDSYDCRDVWFSTNCGGCSDCFGCVNLRNKQYHIFNEAYSKDNYFKKLQEFNIGSNHSLQDIKKLVGDFKLKFPFKSLHGWHNNNVSGGDYVYYSKNAGYCYEAAAVENSKYIQNVADGVADSYDYSNWGNKSELMYEVMSCGEGCSGLKLCFDCWPACRDLEYCMNCHSSSDLFGCVGLKKKQYCIFNKQYSKGEYEKLRAEIIKHMDAMPYHDADGRIYKYGEFFPLENSHLAYNESSACDYYPLTKEGAIKRGLAWRDTNPREYKTTMIAADLPDHINDCQESITKEIIACDSCKRAYRIIPMEFEFLKRFGIPLPRMCHNCRYQERIKLRTPYKWYQRQCQCAGATAEKGDYQNTASHLHGADHCPNNFLTAYASDRPEIVYCESCYNSEVV